MAIDGLKMIHIAGYDADPEEYFEGLSGGGLDLSALIGLGGGSGGTPSDVTVTVTPNITVNVPPTSLPTVPIPQPDTRSWLEKALEDSEPILDSMLGFFGTEAPNVGIPDEDDGGTDRGVSRSPGRSRAFGALVPIVGSLAGAAKLLPAVLKGGAGVTILLNMLNEVGKDIEDFIDPLDPGWRLKGIEDALRSALLVRGLDFEGLDANVSILKEALLRPGLDVDPDGADYNESLIEDIKKILEAMQTAQDQPPIQEEIDVGDLRVIAGKIIEY